MESFVKKGMDEKGVAHIIAAFGFSMAGARFLLKEEAARLECVLFVVAAIVFAVSGVGLWQWIILTMLFLVTLMVEALNTAIELVVDRTSPEISDYGKHTKDLGSFAVFCALSIFCSYAVAVVGFAWLG